MPPSQPRGGGADSYQLFHQGDSMKMMKILAAAMAVALLPIAAAQAQVSERAIKFATQNPKGHPITNGMEKFAEIVTAKTGGKIKVNLFPGGVLGGDAPNISAL